MATGEAVVGQGEEAPDPTRVLIHDFRNLLAVIVNYCELIASETTEPEAIKADIAEIRTAAERAIELTDKLRQLHMHPPESEPAADST